MKKFNTSRGTTFKRNTHTESPEESLVFHKMDDLRVFDINNYDVVDLPLDGTPMAVHRVGAFCKLSGYENEKFDWCAAQADIDQYGQGDTDKWRQYVASSFAAVLESKKEQYLKLWTNPTTRN